MSKAELELDSSQTYAKVHQHALSLLQKKSRIARFQVQAIPNLWFRSEIKGAALSQSHGLRAIPHNTFKKEKVRSAGKVISVQKAQSES